MAVHVQAHAKAHARTHAPVVARATPDKPKYDMKNAEQLSGGVA